MIKEFELADSEKYLDFLNKHEYENNVQRKKFKMKRNFQIYLKIRIYYRLFRTDKDSVNLFYFQQKYEVLRNKFPIKPSDALLLAALSIYSKEGRYSSTNENTTKQMIEKTLDSLVPSKLLDGTFQEIRQRYHNDYLPVYNFKDWANYISEEYQDLHFNSKQEARWEYLSILRYYDLFLSIQF